MNKYYIYYNYKCNIYYKYIHILENNINNENN